MFQDIHNVISISDGTTVFTCPSDEFPRYEPDYLPLSPPYITRQWSDTVQYISTGDTQEEDPFYTPERLAAYENNITAYHTAFADVVIENNYLVEFIGEETPEMQTLREASGGDLLHPSGEPWWVEDAAGTYQIKEYTFRLRTESEFSDTELYLDWQDIEREEKIKSIPWKGLLTLDAQGEFTLNHNLNFTQYIVLLTPFGQSMPDLYVDATTNAISVLGGVPSGKIIYKVELNLR